MNVVDLFGELPDVLLNVVDLGISRIDLFSCLLGRGFVRGLDSGQ